MKSHTKTTLELHDSFDIGKYNGNDESFALSLLSNIMQSIPFISSEIEIDRRPNKSTSNKLGVYQLIEDKERQKLTALVNDIIDSHPDLERGSVSAARLEKIMQ